MKYVFQDAAWSWWCEPKALRFIGSKDKTYLSWVSKNGSQWVGSYNNNTGETEKYMINNRYLADDHNAPCIVPPRPGMENIDPFIVFYTGHNDEQVIRYRKTINPESFASFGEEKAVSFVSGVGITYVQAYRHENKILLFTRTHSSIGRWAFRVSLDGGDTWGNEYLFLDYPSNSYTYMTSKRYSTESDLIFIVVGDIPVNAPRQSLHICKLFLSDGRVEKMDGTIIGNIYSGTNLSFQQDNLSLVYSPQSGEHTRLFDIGATDAEHPELLFMGYTDLVNQSDGVYKYSVWNGTQFTTEEIVATGTIIDDVSYYAGGAIGHKGKLCLARESSGTWYVELWIKHGIWSRVKELDRANGLLNSKAVKLYRPMWVYGSPDEEEFIWVKGTFDDYNTFNTNMILKTKPPKLYKFMINDNGEIKEYMPVVNHGGTIKTVSNIIYH